jgi:hypothetical protein
LRFCPIFREGISRTDGERSVKCGDGTFNFNRLCPTRPHCSIGVPIFQGEVQLLYCVFSFLSKIPKINCRAAAAGCSARSKRGKRLLDLDEPD